MTRPTPRQVASLAVLAVAIGAGFLLVGGFAVDWWRGEGGSYAPAQMQASTRINPSRSLFGDELVAQARVLVDTRTIDPNTVTVAADFSPYQVVSTVRRLQPNIGRAARIDYALRLRCLTLACLDAGLRVDRKGREVTVPIRFQRAHVSGRRRDGTRALTDVGWPSVFVRPRVTSSEVALAKVEVPRPVFPDVTYRFSPGLIGGVLIAGAVMLTAAGGLLVASVIWERSPLRRRTTASAPTPIERALALFRASATAGDTAGERKALELLARVLEDEGKPDLALAASRFAWSEADPEHEAVEALANAARRAVYGSA